MNKPNVLICDICNKEISDKKPCFTIFDLYPTRISIEYVSYREASGASAGVKHICGAECLHKSINEKLQEMYKE